MAIAHRSKRCGSNPLGVQIPHPPPIKHMMLFKKQKKSTEVISKDLIKQVNALEEKFEQTTKDLNELKEDTKRAITKIGITRFNPFKEIGGDQSFSIALLNDNNSGVVVTSYYGREMNRVYAKEIVSGKSETSLAKEESEAVTKAING